MNANAFVMASLPAGQAIRLEWNAYGAFKSIQTALYMAVTHAVFAEGGIAGSISDIAEALAFSAFVAFFCGIRLENLSGAIAIHAIISVFHRSGATAAAAVTGFHVHMCVLTCRK
ncbi:hypothetical protein [Aliamphritea spongicola]|uniref:hypothetical protein n=1 Tax=Aliamphritea spongicola TaxID=707589 RepID=UPI00196A32B2|nr:hypothetical protein [Aliamphritea spongicola]MBN3560542.1 hypothetical protein [Aliamphritea spongicola]